MSVSLSQLEQIVAATEFSDEQRAAILKADQNGHRIVGEPLVYQSRSERSYLSDMLRTARGDSEAGERIERHERQMLAIPREIRVPDTEFEYRINPNVEAGHGGEFTVPLWLNEYFAIAPRPGRVIQRLAHEFDLPSGCSSIAVPRLTKGTLVNDATPGAPVDNQDVETKEVKAQVLDYSGNSDWSIQSLEQSPQGAHLDWAMFVDMTDSLEASLEEDLISGGGESVNEALGLLHISGINEIANTAAVTPTAQFPELAKAMGAVGRKRKRPPDAWLMTSARLAWLGMAAETEQRPLILTDNVGEEWPVASMAGISVYLDDAIGITLGALKNEEPVFCVRADDFLLWHSPVRTAVDLDVLSGSMGVRFQLWRSTASMLHRYPSGISAVTGSGMKAQQGATEYSYA